MLPVKTFNAIYEMEDLKVSIIKSDLIYPFSDEAL